MAALPQSFQLPRKLSPTEDAPWVRVALSLVAIAFLGLFLVLPLVTVFSEALEKGLAEAILAIEEPDTISAIKLTLITAGISVPLNVVFGIAA